jgi:hypothetical protein
MNFIRILIIFIRVFGKGGFKSKIFTRQRINYRLQYETITFLLEYLGILGFKIKDSCSTKN